MRLCINVADYPLHLFSSSTQFFYIVCVGPHTFFLQVLLLLLAARLLQYPGKIFVWGRYVCMQPSFPGPLSTFQKSACYKRNVLSESQYVGTARIRTYVILKQKPYNFIANMLKGYLSTQPSSCLCY